ncbi:MAG TPA: sn-glycerol-3-phosphate ABC transporter ATP-binding protein UgpC [Gemmatimonadales bacterium]|nr:sn-glycerol-3-phosphate ABC transporter ATP-binding protein UgpC [Gemmatimonadales bacterium]
MASVTLQQVRKIYPDRGGEHVAVHGLDLGIADGEFLVLVGPSGCGKSTTLRMIAGLESISSGQLLIGDRLANDIPSRDRDIAMVFQSYALYPHMSVRQNLAFALKLRKLPETEIDRRVGEAAAALGLDQMLDRKPKQLSGGERQRVALGRAIVRQPQVFLFDEPLSNLDAKLRVHMRREIGRLHRELATTMIYVTHDQVEAMTLGDRIAVMSAGRLQQVDTPLGLYQRPANLFVAGFIGSPPMNLIAGTVAGGEGGHGGQGGRVFRSTTGGVSLPLGSEVPALADGAPCTLGLRPEALRVGGEDAPLRGRVELVEPLGSETLVHTEVGQTTIVARFTGEGLPRAGESVGLVPELGRAHWFGEDGVRLEEPGEVDGTPTPH